MRPITSSPSQLRSFVELSVLTILFTLVSTSLHAQSARFEGGQTPLNSSGLAVYGIAVDGFGNVWTADNYSGGVSGLNPAGFIFQSFSVAVPWGLAVDAQGDVFIADYEDSRVLKETRTTSGAYNETVLPTPGLSFPAGIAVDNQGKVYVGELFKADVLTLTPSGGTYVESKLPASGGIDPVSLAVDAGRNVYIADQSNNRVLKETPSGNSYSESIVAQQLALPPGAVTVDGQGNVYISAYSPGDFGVDSFEVKEIPVGNGYTQVAAGFAEYTHALGLATDAAGNLYTAGVKLTFGAGVFPGTRTDTNASVAMVFVFDDAVTLGAPKVLTQGIASPKLDFQDTRNGLCTYQGNGATFAAGQVCSVNVSFTPQVAGTRLGAVALQDATGNTIASGYMYGTGIGPEWTFSPATPYVVHSGIVGPGGAAVDTMGAIYFAATSAGNVYKGVRSGNTYALTAVGSGLDHPAAVALDGKGNLFVAATNTVYKETPAASGWTQSVAAHIAGELTGLAVDGSGNLYVTAAGTGDVHKELLEADGSYVETGVGFGITHPGSVAVDGQGNVYVADPQQGEVDLETITASGAYGQSVIASGLPEPQGVALDGGGNVYITSYANGNVYKEAPQADGSWLQSVLASDLDGPGSIAIDSQGNLYVSLIPAQEIKMLDVADPPIVGFAKTAVGSTSAPQHVTVINAGNGDLSLTAALSSGFTFDKSTTCPVNALTYYSVAAGTSCEYAVDFTPDVAGPKRGSLGLQYENFSVLFNPPITKKTVELREAGITNDATHVALQLSASQINVGAGTLMTAVISDQSHPYIQPQDGTVTLSDTVAGKTTALNGGAAMPLVNGQVSLFVIEKVAGTHTVIAHYSGVDAAYSGSTGTALLSVYK